MQAAWRSLFRSAARTPVARGSSAAGNGAAAAGEAVGGGGTEAAARWNIAAPRWTPPAQPPAGAAAQGAAGSLAFPWASTGSGHAAAFRSPPQLGLKLVHAAEAARSLAATRAGQAGFTLGISVGTVIFHCRYAYAENIVHRAELAARAELASDADADADAADAGDEREALGTRVARATSYLVHKSIETALPTGDLPSVESAAVAHARKQAHAADEMWRRLQARVVDDIRRQNGTDRLEQPSSLLPALASRPLALLCDRSNVAPLAHAALLGVVGAGAAAAEIALVRRAVYGLAFEDMPSLAASASAFLAVTCVRSLAKHAQQARVSSVVDRVLHDVRHELHQHMLTFPVAYFEARDQGSLLAPFTSDLDALEAFLRTALSTGFTSLLQVAVHVLLLFRANAYLGALTLLGFPAARFVARGLAATAGRLVSASSDALAAGRGHSRIVTHLGEMFRGMRVIRPYGLDEHIRSRFRDANAQVFAEARTRAHRNLLVGPASDVAQAASVIAVAASARHLHVSGLVDSAAFVPFVGSLVALRSPLNRLADLRRRFRDVRRSLATVDTILATRVDDVCDADERTSVASDDMEPGAVVVDRVSWGYDGTDILRRASCAVWPGQMVAVVGESGCGKSTLLALLAGLWDAPGVHVAGRVAYMTQLPVLLSGTIADNVRFGAPSASDERVRDALAHAGALDFVDSLPLGTETRVSNDESTLSVGQQQRICLARALVAAPDVLLLDECTSAVDPDTERLIDASLAELRGRCTVIVVTHRPDILSVVDQTLRLVDGALVDVYS